MPWPTSAAMRVASTSLIASANQIDDERLRNDRSKLTARITLQIAAATKTRIAPFDSARFNESRAYRRGRRLSNETGHGNASHNDRITFGTENCERQRASGDAFETDASAIER